MKGHGAENGLTKWGDERHKMTNDPTVLARGRHKRRTRRLMKKSRDIRRKKQKQQKKDASMPCAHRKECGSKKIDEGGKDNHYNTCFEGAISTSCLNSIPF